MREYTSHSDIQHAPSALIES